MLRTAFKALVLQPLSLFFSIPPNKWILKRISFPGKANIAWRLKTRGNATCTIGAFKMHLNLSDPIHRLFAFDCFEESNISYALNRIEPGDICLDIGANVGYFSFKMASACGVHGKVYAFEPARNIFRSLSYNTKLNPSLPVEAYPMAIASQCAPLGYAPPPPDNSGNGRVIHDKSSKCPYQVDAITLDSFIESKGLTKIKFLKADIEGSEMQMLRGAKNSLSAKLFTYIMVEFNEPLQKDVGFTLTDIVQEVTQYGYTLETTPELESYKKGLLTGDRAVFDLFFRAK